MAKKDLLKSQMKRPAPLKRTQPADDAKMTEAVKRVAQGDEGAGGEQGVAPHSASTSPDPITATGAAVTPAPVAAPAAAASATPAAGSTRGEQEENPAADATTGSKAKATRTARSGKEERTTPPTAPGRGGRGGAARANKAAAAAAAAAPAATTEEEEDDKEPLKRMTIDLPKSLHTRLKLDSARRGVYMKDHIIELIEKSLQ